MFIPKDHSDKLRLVTDYRSVNKLIKCPSTYFAPSDSIKKSLSTDSKIFATIDVASRYHQIKVSEEDRNIKTFITPFGQFRFKRLPMGLSPSGDYFNIKTDNLI